MSGADFELYEGIESTTPPDLPWTVRMCVEWWARRHAYLEYPDRARGECGVESWNVAGFVFEKAGVSLEVVTGDLPQDTDEPPHYDCHTMCLWNGCWVIDVTARQYWRDSPYPLIERIDVYSKRFQRLIGDDDECQPEDLLHGFHIRFPTSS